MFDAIDIEKSYKNNKILTNCSIHLDYGEIVSLEGPSGSGKTTFARILSFYKRPDVGRIVLDGESIKTQKEVRGRIHLISQHPYSAFNPELTIFKSLSEGPLFLGLADKENYNDYLEEYLEKANADKDLLNRYPRELSGGELQRFSIARALSLRPKILICDEITSNLDAITTREIVENIKSLNLDNLSILFITHQRDVSRYISSRSYKIQNCTISDSSVS